VIRTGVNFLGVSGALVTSGMLWFAVPCGGGTTDGRPLAAKPGDDLFSEGRIPRLSI